MGFVKFLILGVFRIIGLLFFFEVSNLKEEMEEREITY